MVKYDEQSYNKGIDTERAFYMKAISAKFKVKLASSSEDKNGFDFVLTKDGQSQKVEVKSYKSTHPDSYLVELVGITGYAGWATKQADKIAFENSQGNFELVSRVDLLECSKGLPATHRESRPLERVVLVPKQKVNKEIL